MQENVGYFDAEAQRYRELGDNDAASALQDAGDRARSFIGGSAQPDSGDTSSSPPDDHLDSADTGNEEPPAGRIQPPTLPATHKSGPSQLWLDLMRCPVGDASADEQDRRDRDRRDQDQRDQDRRDRQL